MDPPNRTDPVDNAVQRIKQALDWIEFNPALLENKPMRGIYLAMVAADQKMKEDESRIEALEASVARTQKALDDLTEEVEAAEVEAFEMEE